MGSSKKLSRSATHQELTRLAARIEMWDPFGFEAETGVLGAIDFDQAMPSGRRKEMGTDSYN
jgi:hypothetical protein